MRQIWIILFLVSTSIVSAQVPDYLRPVSSDVSPAVQARMGQPVVANMVLKRVGVVPEEAKLNITVELEAPRVEVRIDNNTEVFGIKEFEVDLPPDGVSEIEIRASGYAPPVEKQTEIRALAVKTYVLYKGEEGQYQDDGALTLIVSTKEIKETLLVLEDAKDLLAEADSLISDLKAKGVNTAELEAELADARDQISRSEAEHEQGDIENAKFLAEQAKKDLNRIITKAKEMGAGPTPVDIKRYLTIAAAVIIVIIVAFFLRGRREELG
jgi:hypothetical protein